jgi:hypothetical protein
MGDALGIGFSSVRGVYWVAAAILLRRVCSAGAKAGGGQEKTH